MDLVEVDLFNAQSLHARRGCSLKLIISEIGPVDLRCNNKFFSANLSKGSSYDLSTVPVAVGLGGVYEIHAELVAPGDGAYYLFVIALPQVASLPDAHSDSRYFGTILSQGTNFHFQKSSHNAGLTRGTDVIDTP